jgi:hypothetical protein
VFATSAIVLAATASSAHADFACLRVEPYVGGGWVENGFGNLTAWRIYAEFTSPADMLISVFGIPDHPMYVSSSDGVFHNDPEHDALLAPCNYTQPPESYWANQWDTYVTMDAEDCALDPTGISPGFGAEVNNLASDFTTTNAAWFVTPASPGGFILAGFDLRILLGQFVVAEGESISGILNLQYVDTIGNTLMIVGEPVEGPAPCPEDLNGDGVVDVTDLLELLGAWGLCVCCPADLDGNRYVYVPDLLQLLGAWGPCPESNGLR